MPEYSGERFTCPDCSKKLKGVIPAHGDGTAFVFPRHTGEQGKQCASSRTMVDEQFRRAASKHLFRKDSNG